MIKKIFIYILCAFSIFLINTSVFAKDKITVTAEINKITNKTDVTFKYVLTEGEFNEPTSGTLEKNFEISLNNVDVVGNKISNSHEIDFSTVVYSSPGNYEYILKETEVDNSSFNISTKEYKIYVSVRNYGGTLTTVVADQAVDMDQNEKEDIVYSHEPDYAYISFFTEVIGKTKEEDKDQYFKYRIIIRGNVGSKYKVVGQDPTVTFDGESITTSDYYEVKDGEENYLYVYAKHGQLVTIGLDGENYEVPVGTAFSIEKMEGNKWTTLINEKTVNNDKESFVTNNSDAVIIQHRRTYDIAITGLFVKHGPIILLIALSIISLYVLKRMKINETTR